MNIQNSKTAGGFSLVEVTLAMAIAAIALVTLMGMIPQGMNTMREAGDSAIEARIHQQILNELQMSEFDVLDTQYDQMVLYYDNQGEEIGDSRNGYRAGQDDFGHTYSAQITIPNLGMSFGDGNINTEIKQAVVQIAVTSGQGEGFDFTDDSNQNVISTYQTSVVKLRQ